MSGMPTGVLRTVEQTGINLCGGMKNRGEGHDDHDRREQLMTPMTAHQMPLSNLDVL